MLFHKLSSIIHNINVKNITKDTQRKLNKLLKDTKSGLSKFQTTGHEKWKSVYTKTQIIDWPYYYPAPVVDVEE